MVKKLLSFILASLMIVSCFPISSHAAEAEENPSGASSVVIENVSKGTYIDIIVSIDPVTNVQGILLDLDKAYSKFQYQSYEVMDTRLNQGSVVVNSSPDGYTYSDIMAALQFPDGGVTYTQKTDLLKLRFKARTAVTSYTYGFTVKEIYNANLTELNSNIMSVRCGSSLTSDTKTLSSVSVTAPSKTTYNAGETFNTSGMVVTAVYSDGSQEDVTSKATVSSPDMSTAGTKSVTVTYEGKTASFNITVKAIELSSISVVNKPTKTTYYVGESFNSAGMKITATYSNSSTKDVTSSAKVSGFSSTAAGTKTITVSYTEGSVTKTATFTVTVKDNEVTGLTVTKPTKTSYFIGDSFDSSGMKVVASYTDGTTKDVTSGVIVSGFNSTTAGTKTLTVSYGGKTSTFTVTVSTISVTGISIASKPTKTEYYVGDSFSSSGLKITATYNNGLTADVTSLATLTGFSSTSAGTKTITATYSSKTATFTVTVKAIAVESISLNTTNAKKTYYVNESFDKTGIVVTAKNNNSSTEDVTSKATFSGFDSKTTGTKTITVSYGGKSATFTVTVKAALSNTSTVSAATVKIGETVTATGKASGGSGGYKYAFYYRLGGSTAWTTKGTAYGSDTSMAFSPVNHGTYEIKVGVKDSEGHVVEKTFTVTVNYAALKNNSTITNSTSGDISKSYVGDTVKMTPAASGGSGKYTYTYSYKESTSSTWTSLSSASFTPSKAATYNFKVVVSDVNSSSSEVISPVSKEFTVTVNPKLVNNSTVSTTSVYAGDTITIKGAAAGGAGTYKYSYYYKQSANTNWIAIGELDVTTTTATLKPSVVTKYDIMVRIKDKNNRRMDKTFTVTVTNKALVNNSKVSATSVYAGDTITITGAGADGAGDYKYSYYYKQSSNTGWIAIGDLNVTTTTATLKPSVVTKYDIMVRVRDKNNRTKDKNFTVTVTNKALVNNSKVSATSVYAGDTITITGAGADGAGDYKYSYYYKQSSNTGWIAIGDLNVTTTTATLKPSVVTKYDIMVRVRDKNNRTKDKNFTVTVTNKALVNNSKVSTTNLTKGDTLTITGAASGGAGGYTYAFYYKQSSTTGWRAIGDLYGTAKTATLKPSVLTDYDIMVRVKDSNGRMAEKKFVVTVSDNVQAQVVELVNAERAKVGLPALKVNSTLTTLAAMKSQDMHDLKYFDHTSPTYGTPFEMMEKYGVSYRAAGENIARGQTTPEAVMKSWMNSEGHRENILCSDFTQIGVGYVADGNYWTQMFIG